MGGVGRSVHTFRHGFLVKFRKSRHWTEKSLRHAQKPATPRSANPCGPESTSVTPGKDPPMATPPKGRKMAPERPFPILIETGKSHPKTGLCPAVCRRFSRWFAGGLPAALPPPPGPPPQKGPGGHHVKERWWFRRTGGQPDHPGLEGALNRLTAPHVNTPPRSMVGSSAGAYQNPIHPSIMAARLWLLDYVRST